MPRLPLSQLLADKLSWSLRERLVLTRRLALAIQVLHRQGQTHRSLDPATITLGEQFQPQLGPPAGPRRFGGDQSDPEFCPPELAQSSAVELPAEIEAATAILRQRGISLDPRRIDVYQLGVLLCQLLTGEPFLNYLYSPTCKAKVPPLARALLNSCLGENPAGPLADCDAMLAALDDLIRQLPRDQRTSSLETPPSGSAVISPGDTPPHGKVDALAAETPAGEKLRFEQLGHFQIVGQIGSGGMGDVYRGYDASLDRYVAIKVLAEALARDAEFVRRFSAEATAVAKLSHPNVVPIYFIGQDAGHHFFAMQFIKGQSLAERLARDKRLPVDEAVTIIEQCLAGLGAAHAQGLIHRDIKPGNILLEQASGRAVLVDFGLVRHLNADSRMTATGVVMGTVDYLAPEQARGRMVDGRTDIYSVGVMFYELLVGRLPFIADSPTAMIFQHAYETPFPLKKAAPDVPQPLVDVVARMMAKEPAERYASCAAVLADLRAFREGRPVEAASASQTSAASSIPTDELAADWEPGHILLPSENPWQRAKDWAATMFRRHAPQYVQEMQDTTLQMDAAVAHYERRCKRLADLLKEARSIETELSEQIDAQLAAAAQAKKQEYEDNVAALRSHRDLQRQQVEELQRQLSKADATLASLRSRQNVLKSRLQVAEAHRRLKGGLPPPNRRRWLLPIAVGAGVVALVLLHLIESTPVNKVGSDYRGTTLSRVHPAAEAVPTESAGAVFVDQQAFIIGNWPYYMTLADMARQKGMTPRRSFNTQYDELLPQAKGHELLIETHDGSPIVPLPVLDQVFPGASKGLKASDGIVNIGDTKIVFVDFSPPLKGMTGNSASVGSLDRQVFVVGNSPYYETLTEMAQRKGMTVTKSFNCNYDELLPQAKGHALLIETHHHIPIVPMPVLEKFYPGASKGLKTADGVVTVENTRIIFVDLSRLLPASDELRRRGK
jgi:serine/threonine protein kinase